MAYIMETKDLDSVVWLADRYPSTHDAGGLGCKASIFYCFFPLAAIAFVICIISSYLLDVPCSRHFRALRSIDVIVTYSVSKALDCYTASLLGSRQTDRPLIPSAFPSDVTGNKRSVQKEQDSVAQPSLMAARIYVMLMYNDYRYMELVLRCGPKQL